MLPCLNLNLPQSFNSVLYTHTQPVTLFEKLEVLTKSLRKLKHAMMLNLQLYISGKLSLSTQNLAVFTLHKYKSYEPQQKLFPINIVRILFANAKENKNLWFAFLRSKNIAPVTMVRYINNSTKTRLAWVQN